ncbi:MAG: 1,4-dihydroxy-2-naphthoate polyprenyltransferase [Candidatus Nanopelagicales bacterium]
MATVAQWVAGARPRTLPAAVTPVAVGTGVAAYEGSVQAGRAALALVVALALQVGANYANDYSDGIRGTDEVRVGPVRLVGQRLAAPRAVRTAALASFAVAAVAGLVLVVLTAAWWLLAVGAASVVAAWLYTGGPRPYGYAGLGELFVFVFFGLVAVTGTAYVQTGSITWLAVTASVPTGLLICDVLVANNLRDIPGDAAVGKRTLAVRLGDARTRVMYVSLVGAAFAVTVGIVVVAPWAALALVAAVLAVPPVRAVTSGARGRDLIPVLQATGTLLLVHGVLLAVGLALSG